MASHLDDKTFFKEMTKEAQDYSSEFSEAFPYFCIKIYWDHLSHEEVESAIDGLNSCDGSIDGFFVDHENKEINFIQCKSVQSFKNKSKKAKKEWLSYLNEAPRKLEDDIYIDNHPNRRIQEIAEEYKLYSQKERYKNILNLFHLGECTDHTKRHYKDKIKYCGWDEIKEKYEEYKSKLDRTEPEAIEIKLNHGHIEPNFRDRDHQTFVSLIGGDEVVRLREQFLYKLFDKNLRFGLGKNKINKEIINTAKERPNNFYYFNNGLTITSHGFKVKSKTDSKSLRIKYPQIINGAQTVNSIYAAYSEKLNESRRKNPQENNEEIVKKHFEAIQILFRVIYDKNCEHREGSEWEKNVTH